MKISAIRVLLTITLSFAGGGGALAQEAGIDPDADCAAVLAAPPFDDMLTRNEGWEFLEFNERSSPGGPIGVPGAEYYLDAVAHYCLKRPTLFGTFDFRCRPIVRISFLDGRISNLGTYNSK